jgi:large subunit ribosomal protein L9
MANVKLILKEDIAGLGHAGDVVSVKPGFAKNFLVPQGKATQASEGKIREIEHLKKQIADKVAKELADLKKTQKAIEGLSLEVKAKAGEEGKLFGSVTPAQIAELLQARGYEIDRRKIDLDAIKEIGEHAVKVKLHRDVVATVKVQVTAEE